MDGLAAQSRQRSLVLAVVTAISLPAARGGSGAGGFPPMTGPALRLISASFLLGTASTALWSFGGEFVSTQVGWGPTCWSSPKPTCAIRVCHHVRAIKNDSPVHPH